MTRLRPGDVITDEPTEIGAVVITRVMEAYLHTENLTWCCCSRGVTCTKCTTHWGELPGPIRYAFGPHAPADNENTSVSPEWELIAATQVKVGDHIEVAQIWDGGRSLTTGTVTSRVGSVAYFGGRHALTIEMVADLYTSVTIRRRVRQPMPEPAAPAVVRHAGRLLVRSKYQHLLGSRWSWLIVSGPIGPGETRPFGLPWADVLALDPTTDPVPVDLGGGVW